MNDKEIQAHKKKIDKMSHEDMCRLWRFSPAGHPYFQPPLYDYYLKRFKEFGMMTFEMSHKIGWDG